MHRSMAALVAFFLSLIALVVPILASPLRTLEPRQPVAFTLIEVSTPSELSSRVGNELAGKVRSTAELAEKARNYIQEAEEDFFATLKSSLEKPSSKKFEGFAARAPSDQDGNQQVPLGVVQRPQSKVDVQRRLNWWKGVLGEERCGDSRGCE